MKRFFSMLWIVSMVIVTTSCQAQSNKKENIRDQVSSEEISIYYFHFTRRCATCKAIESESLKAIEALYPEQFSSGQITFQSYNLDESESKTVADKLKVAGQALLIVKGENINDLTNQGFMYARTNPAKFHAELEKAIGKL